MKGISAKVTKALQVGSYLVCADNTGAKELKIIGVVKYKGVKRRIPRAGVGDIVVVSVRKGTPDMKKKVFWAVIVRQKKPYRRANGMRVAFEDNAAVLINENGDPKGTEIKGPIAKEVAERFSQVARIATMVV